MTIREYLEQAEFDQLSPHAQKAAQTKGRAWAQEEALCSESNLYPILVTQKESFYDANRQYSRGGLYTDRSLFVPDVVFARGGSVRNDDCKAFRSVFGREKIPRYLCALL